MRRSLVTLLVVAAAALATAAFAQSFSVSLGRTKGPTQPILFSHRVHAGRLGMDCLYCHYGALYSPIANIPSVGTCMGCHKIAMTDRPEVRKLTEYFNRGEVVPWREVYKLPEHVKFNHKRHVRANIQCEECHGPVNQMDVVYQWPSLKMGWCITCHRQKLNDPQFPASMDCVTCHH